MTHQNMNALNLDPPHAVIPPLKLLNQNNAYGNRIKSQMLIKDTSDYLAKQKTYNNPQIDLIPVYSTGIPHRQIYPPQYTGSDQYVLPPTQKYGMYLKISKVSRPNNNYRSQRRRRRRRRKDVYCFDCGMHGHVASQCPNLCCFECGGYGHFARKCPNNNQKAKEFTKKKQKRKRKTKKNNYNYIRKSYDYNKYKSSSELQQIPNVDEKNKEGTKYKSNTKQAEDVTSDTSSVRSEGHFIAAAACLNDVDSDAKSNKDLHDGLDKYAEAAMNEEIQSQEVVSQHNSNNVACLFDFLFSLSLSITQ